jgi:nucleoside-diphosphate kinase
MGTCNCHSNEEFTIILIKPDAVKRGLIGKIIGRFEDANLKICDLKMMKCSVERISNHYHEHLEKSFFKDLLKHMTSGPLIALRVVGENAVEKARQMIGDTDPSKAAPGTIRGDWGGSGPRNLVHASDSVESAVREFHVFWW